MADEIIAGTELVHDFGNQHGREAQHIVAGYKAVDILERLQVVDAHIEQRPVLFADDAAELLFDQPPGRQARTRIGEAFPFRAPNGALDTQLQFLDVKWLGDVIVCAKLQSLQSVTALILLRQEDDGNMACACARPQVAADLVAVDIGQHDIEHDQLGQDMLGLFQGIRPAVRDIHVKGHAREVDLEHVRNINVVFDDQKAGLCHRASYARPAMPALRSRCLPVSIAAHNLDLFVCDLTLKRAKTAQSKPVLARPML